MAKKMQWLPVVDAKRCVACGRCVKVCGLELRRISENVAILDHPERCPGEGICAIACASHAISMEWVLIGEGRAAA